MLHYATFCGMGGKHYIHIHIKMGRKNVRKWRANFTKKAITRERNEISSPNSVHMCKSSIFGQIKKIAIRWKKHKNSYNYARVS